MCGRVCEEWAVAMEPIMAIGIVGDTGEVVQANDSRGDVHEGGEEIKEVIWGTGSAAG
jgi:hypothetical protein